ncbi:MAG: glutamine synthetase [Candidatus Fermentibacteraceae bacterium]|nr:glutamine synthetase [Candidatus Fermentibacteraceae bacterium]MBN2608462.1 glutamine synthetase [Candidatus Fermentibacteraceae bacterium]
MANIAETVLSRCRQENVHFLRLQFTDIDGIIKNVEVPESQFTKALEGQVMFDGSSIEGFTRIEESDMVLVPELGTFAVFPWETDHGKVGRLICDVVDPDGNPFAGCPRTLLKKQLGLAEDLGFRVMAGPEAEFFLFQVDDSGYPLTRTHDRGGYFDLSPVDRGEEARRDIAMVLESMGYEVEAAHHEVAPGQHEIDFRYADAVTTADNIVTFRFVVKKVALAHGLHATFMPKPLSDVAGSGMHMNMSLLSPEGENAFDDPDGRNGLSKTARGFIAGLLNHARALVAVTNPLVNSYKRLVPGYEAPVNVAWSEKNRSPLIRVPAKKGTETRCEVRVPDPSCNPYLALTVLLAAGLDGIRNGMDCGEPVNRNIFQMSMREKRRLKIFQLPSNLFEALNLLERDAVLREAMGEHIFSHFMFNKRREWDEYIRVIHNWEIDRYLDRY